MQVTLYTSGSTNSPKLITHFDIKKYIDRSLAETKLSKHDIVLDVFPSNVIAHYTVTAQPALSVGAHLITANFDPYTYIKLFKEYQPSFIALIPRHIEILEKTKEWGLLDMSCVRYMVTGSQPVKQSMIDMLNNKGIQLVANWYGMTEFPPPIFVGYNSENFNFLTATENIDFTKDGECIINGVHTGDIFDLTRCNFLRRKTNLKNNTWKTL